MTAASFLLRSPFGVGLPFFGGERGGRFTDISRKSENVCKLHGTIWKTTRNIRRKAPKW